jgi:plastocyanin
VLRSNLLDMRIFRLVLCALVSIALLAPPAAAAVAAAGPGGFVAGFATPVVVVERGETLTFYNADVPMHDFVAVDAFTPRALERKTKWCSGYRRGRCPLFWSARIGVGGSTKVLGLTRVKPGKQYSFYCTVHPGMKGTLIVR